MRISFKLADDGSTNEIFVNDFHIGLVRSDVWSGKWKLKPNFTLGSYTKDNVLKEKYDSAYKAGKALVSLYQNMKRFNHEEDIFEDTQDIDMKDIFKSFHIP
jgi:hypothetical protein|tara:strand:+ start:163 stop:468 length:306 start_codon:yes stop_codon:yes gene_type:complete